MEHLRPPLYGDALTVLPARAPPGHHPPAGDRERPFASPPYFLGWGLVGGAYPDWREHRGELVDIPGMVVAAGHAAGLTLIDRCVALIAAIRNGQLIPRASFFQLHNIRLAHQNGDPQWLLQHELVHIFQATSRAPNRAASRRKMRTRTPHHLPAAGSVDV